MVNEDMMISKIEKFYSATFPDHKVEFKKSRPGLFRIYFSIIPDSKIRVNVDVDFETMLIGKGLVEYRTFISFTPRELEFFDKLGFDLGETHAELTGQDISDWWE